MPNSVLETRIQSNLNTSMAGRPKLLFLACYFPPLQSSASVRTWNIAKHLARRGWEVTVATPDPSMWRNVEDADAVHADLKRAGVKRIVTGYRWRFLSPELLRCWNHGLGWVLGGMCRKVCRYMEVDKGYGWIGEAEIACRSIRADDVDVILATGQPFSSFVLAKRLADKLDRPYVLDYRDPWTNPHHGQFSARRFVLEQEEQLVNSSSAITMVSPSLLNGRYELGKKFHVVTNGFDPEELDQVEAHRFGHRAIVYTGIFHPPKRVITPIMRALDVLQRRQSPTDTDWRFHYYGPQNEHVQQEAQRFGLRDRVVLHGLVPRADALAAIRGAALTVVITSVLEETADADKGIVTGKLFDALGLGTPVLIVGPRGGDVEEIIQTTGLTQIVPAGDIDGIASCLEKAMTGKAPPPKNPQTYGWPNLIKKMDILLRNAMNQSESSRRRCDHS